MFLQKITDKYLTTSMKKELLNNKVLCENYKNFRRLVEYSTLGSTNIMAEAGEENQNDPMNGANPSMGGNDMADPMAGGDPSMDGGEAQPPQGFNPQGGEQEQLGATPETDPNQEEEEVIDVDDLTNSQEATEKKIDALSDKFERLIGMLDGFEKQIDSSNERMETLRAEIEKRNPTPVEKMSIRAKNSYPFNITPDEYWKDKEATSNYSPEDDNNGADDPVYQITKDDIDNISDWNSIYKSLDDKHDSLRDLFGY